MDGLSALVVGGGPGGLSTAIALRQSGVSRTVTVADRAPSALAGLGVVFSARGLQSLDTELARLIVERSSGWDLLEMRVREDAVRIPGHSYRAIRRGALLDLLRRRCDELGVVVEQREVSVDDEVLASFDLVVAADGAWSRQRRAHRQALRPTFGLSANWHMWLGTRAVFAGLTFAFAVGPEGPLGAHAYPHGEGGSTFIVESPGATGDEISRPADDADVRAIGEAFAPHLGGEPLAGAQARWERFLTLDCERYWHRNLVLVGDAAHTTHFSLGSGTSIAMGDGAALAQALETAERLDEGLAAYTERRQRELAMLRIRSSASAAWWEQFPARVAGPPRTVAMHFLTRTGRLPLEPLLGGNGAAGVLAEPTRVGQLRLANPVVAWHGSGAPATEALSPALLLFDAAVPEDGPSASRRGVCLPSADGEAWGAWTARTLDRATRAWADGADAVIADLGRPQLDGHGPADLADIHGRRPPGKLLLYLIEIDPLGVDVEWLRAVCDRLRTTCDAVALSTRWDGTGLPPGLVVAADVIADHAELPVVVLDGVRNRDEATALVASGRAALTAISPRRSA